MRAMASLLVKIFLSKDFELWKKSSSDLETVFNDHSLDIVMNKKVMGQNSVLLVIEGSPDNTAIPNKPYTYTIETPGTTCSPTIQGGTITIVEGPKFELISAALTDSQESCNGSNIVDIEYKVTGAGGAQIPALVPATFSGLPNDNATEANKGAKPVNKRVEIVPPTNDANAAVTRAT